MLYTGKGDNGQTKLYQCDQSLAKSSSIAEALGALDEINSLLGWCKVKAEKRATLASTIEDIKNNLFSIQAELAGTPKKLSKTAVTKAENLINKIEKEIPPVKSFIMAGGTELSAMLDLARAVARRAERKVVVLQSDSGQVVFGAKNVKLASVTLAYLNRLSSLLYVLARLANHQAGVREKGPKYK